MTQSISLLFGVHAHQPVGNFPEVINRVHERCYRPFIHTLYHYSEFNFSWHCSGGLLEYLAKQYPHDIALLRKMVERGQVELFGGGLFEPVLASLPEWDRIGQIKAFSARLAETFGSKPNGAWLTERVWEASVVPTLAQCGIRYVTVDDYHFLCAGKTIEELKGYYTTEEGGITLDLFPISEALRYRIPFSPASEVIAHLESFEINGAAIYFDDIEKFGVWPETYEWVYEKGWLKEFIERILASKKVRVEHYRDYHRLHATRGIVYLPTTSYIEMNEWALPGPIARHYADLVEAEKKQGRFEQHKAFLRGGIWRNFLSRYPESNWMHKRVLQLSKRLHDLPSRQLTPVMQNLLYQAQSNDAYWHGLFGGLYLPHLRRAIYKAIVNLEKKIDKIAKRESWIRTDFNLDGIDEIFVGNETLQVIVPLEGCAAIREWDSYTLQHNFGDTLSRQIENYHFKLSHSTPERQSEGIVSPHERVIFKHEIKASDTVVDKYYKGLFVDFPGKKGNEEKRKPICYHYQSELRPKLVFVCNEIGLQKEIKVQKDKLQVEYRFLSEELTSIEIEINLAMPSCDGAGGRYVHQGKIIGGLAQTYHLIGVERIALEDAILEGQVKLTTNHPIEFESSPHFSVSQSEEGVEKIMQAVTLLLRFDIVQPNDSLTVTLEAASIESWL